MNIVSFFSPWLIAGITAFLVWLIADQARMNTVWSIGAWIIVLVGGSVMTFILFGDWVAITYETTMHRFAVVVWSILATFLLALLIGLLIVSLDQKLDIFQLWACVCTAFLASSAAYHWIDLLGQGLGNTVASIIAAIVAFIAAYWASQLGDELGNPIPAGPAVFDS